MTSQSTLGEDVGIAEELAESQRAISIAEFFEKNKHMLGFDSGARALVTAIKEGVDNSLDAAEEADIAPDIYVEVEDLGDYYRVVIEDNGPGITKEQLPKIFGKLLYGSRFHKREQSVTPEQRVLIRHDGTVRTIPIGVLCDAYLPDTGADHVPVPDTIEVPAFNRETSSVTWQPVTHVTRHETDEQTYQITTTTGRTATVTGNHSLFGMTPDGTPQEHKASTLTPGDMILAPKRLPQPDTTPTSINLLAHIAPESLHDRSLYVHDIDDQILTSLRDADPSTWPSQLSAFSTTHLQTCLAQQCLPATAVLALGWTDRVADCTLQPSADPTVGPAVPVTIESLAPFVDALAQTLQQDAVADTTADKLQHAVQADSQVSLVTSSGSTGHQSSTPPSTTPLTTICTAILEDSSIPAVLFDLEPQLQRRFLETLAAAGTQSQADTWTVRAAPALARQLSILWAMQGVVTETTPVAPEQHQVTAVSGDGGALTADAPDSPEQIPTTILDPVRVQDVAVDRVPNTVPGILFGAGIGTSYQDAAQYHALIEDIATGHTPDAPARIAHLTHWGLLDETGTPTDRFDALQAMIDRLQVVADSDLCLLQIADVKQTSPPEHVYDLSVPGATGQDENFIVCNEGPISIKNSRGQQGIGISAAVLYSQLTSGKPAKVTSRTQSNDQAQYFELVIDTDSNEPEIRDEQTTTWDRPHGTRIELEMEATMRARKQLHEYIKHTAVVNPHARIELREPGLDEPLKFERATDQLPADTEEIRPHPHGVELGTLLKMLEATESHSVSGFLQSEFTRVGRKTADSIIDAFRDRYYGRAFTWSTPDPQESIDIAAIVRDATANKGQKATAAFADRIATRVADTDRVSYHDVETIVATAADAVADTYDRPFGDTVRANVTTALWEAIAATDRCRVDCYRVLDAVTTARKDDATLEGIADRLAEKLASEAGPYDRVTAEELRTYIDRAADMTERREDITFGETARDNVQEALWEHTQTVPDTPPKIRTLAGDRDTASDLLEAMRSVSVLSPPTSCLSPITAELVEAGLKKEYNADFYTATTRDAEVHGGDPFIVEAGIAYGGDLEQGSVDLMRFANRVPLVYQRGACAITDVVKSIGWRNYKLDQPGGSGLPKGPVVLLVHVASTNVPFTSESKDAVANVPEIEDEIELAIREAARDLKSYLKKKQSMQQRRRKRDALADILPEMAQKVAEVTDREEPNYGDALARIMNNVLIERHAEVATDGDYRTVHLTVENHTNASETFEVTEIVSEEPTGLPDAVTAVEVDDEWFIKWSPTVDAGGTETLTYRVSDTADFDLSVDGIETAKLTITA